VTGSWYCVMDEFSSVAKSPAQMQWVAVVAVFGAVWGAAEISLGAILRSASIPMHGTVMAGVGILIMLVARRTLSGGGQRGRGGSLAVGVVAAAMLPLSVTRGIVPAMIGILAEAACLEIVLWMGRPGRWRFAAAGLLAALVPLAQLLVMLAVQYGPAAISTFREMLLVKQGGARLGLAGQTAGTLMALILGVSGLYGLTCGMLAWSVAGQILRRLGREAD
jgi:hypothetical protein